MVPFHRIGARLYNTPLLLVPASALAASDYLLSRVSDRGVVPTNRSRASRFVGSHETEDGRWVPYRVTDGTAIVSVVGELVNRSFGFADADCGLVSYEYIQHQIAAAIGDPRVLDIVLDVDSPGGEVNGCFALNKFIRAARAKKPIIGFGNAHALSGGYATICAATEIVAPEDSEHGSIGVWMLIYDLSKHLEQQGVKPRLFYRGAHKVDGNPFEELSESAAAEFDAKMEMVYTMFVAAVEASRPNLTAEAIRATEARIFYAPEALRLGLIDRIGTLDDAIALARSMRRANPAAAAANPTIQVKSRQPHGAAGKKIQAPRVSALATEVNMENCARANCGHPREENHPEDGPCTAEGCECQGYVPEEEEEEEAAPPAATGKARKETPAQELARVKAENARLLARGHTEARKRIAAEVAQETAPLLSRSDLRYNVGEVGIIGNVLLVAKAAAAGLPSIAVPDGEGKTRELQLNVKSMGAFYTTQVQALITGDAKFAAPAGTLQQPPASTGGTHRSTVSAADFARSGVDPAAAQRISDEVARRQRVNANFTRADLEREVTRR